MTISETNALAAEALARMKQMKPANFYAGRKGICGGVELPPVPRGSRTAGRLALFRVRGDRVVMQTRVHKGRAGNGQARLIDHALPPDVQKVARRLLNAIP